MERQYLMRIQRRHTPDSDTWYEAYWADPEFEEQAAADVAAVNEHYGWEKYRLRSESVDNAEQDQDNDNDQGDQAGM
jgi:hypothetical protein